MYIACYVYPTRLCKRVNTDHKAKHLGRFTACKKMFTEANSGKFSLSYMLALTHFVSRKLAGLCKEHCGKHMRTFITFPSCHRVTSRACPWGETRHLQLPYLHLNKATSNVTRGALLALLKVKNIYIKITTRSCHKAHWPQVQALWL